MVHVYTGCNKIAEFKMNDKNNENLSWKFDSTLNE